MKRARENSNVPADGIPAELRRLIEEALQCLEDTDLQGASAVLEKACGAVASPREDARSLRGHIGVDDGAAQGATKWARPPMGAPIGPPGNGRP
jgi:hypothetical protein